MSTKEVKVKVTGDVSDLLKKLEQAKDSIEDLGKGVNKSTNKGIDGLNNDLDELRKNAEKTADSLDDLYNATKKPSKNNFSGMADDITDVSKKINIAVDDIKDFSKQVDSLDNASLGKLNKSLIDMDDTTKKIHNSIKDAGENLFEGLDVNKLNKFKNSFGDITTSSKKAESSLAGTVAQTAALGSSVIIGVAGLSKLKNKIAETAAESAKIKLAMKDITDSMGSCALKMTSLADESEKLYGKITKAFEKALEAQAKLDQATKLNNAEDIEKYSKEVIKYSEEVKKLGNEHHELSNKTNEVKAEVEQLVKKFAELSTQDKEVEKSLKNMVETFNKIAKAARENGQAIDDIDYDKLINEALEAAKANDKVADSTDKAGDSLDKLKGKTSKLKEVLGKLKDLDFSGAFDSLKDVGDDIFKNIGKSIENTGSQLSDFGSKLSELGGIKGKFGSFISSLGSGMSSLGSSMAASAGILSSTIGTVVALSGALVKLYDIGKKQFFEGLSNIKSKLQPAIDAIKSFGREAINAFEEITNTQLDLSSLMQVGVEFEYQMQKVGSIAGANEKQLQQLTDAASRLGGTTQFTASQVGEAFQYMAMAGYSTEEMLASIDGVLNLAIISGSDLGTVSDIVTDGLTALGMSASDAGEFVDKMAATITSSNTTVELFGETLKQVGALAGSLGINMTDMSTATGLMANAGVKGSRAGTALKNVLSNMAAPTKKQAAALQQLGLTADETGSYLKTTADGNVDLAATMKSLMKATEGMDKTQKAAILTQIAGKEAVAGLMSIMNQGEEAWDELSTTIENSTGKVQYWNECMSLAGKSGSEAVKLIDNMKQVFSEVESEAQAAGLSTEDLANAIALLGDDGKVTADNVRDLINVLDDMGTATGKQEEKWRALDKTGKSAVNTNFDYDATVSAITADTQGLTQAQKENMIAELGKAKTYEEAIAIGKKYSQGNIDMTKTIERASFANMSYAEKLDYLRDNLKGLSEEERRAALENLGLGDAFDEINEIVDMSDEKFEAYNKNLETIQSMTEQLANAMDEVTKGSLLSLASAIQNVAISAFESLKPAIQNASDALTEFFDTWHNGDKNEFTFTGLENGLKGLEQKIRGAIPNIQQAVADLFSGLDRFVNGGSLDSILKIGTDVVTGICKGISEAKENGSLDRAIDGAIKKICGWIKDNGDQIEQAGLDILDSIKTGIENNKDEINDALDVLCGVIESWAQSSAELESAANTFADRFIELAGKQIGLKLKTEGLKWLQVPTKFLNPDLGKNPDGSDDSPEKQNFKKQTSLGNILGNLWNKGKEWLLGESHAAEVGEKDGTAYTGGVKKGLLSNAPYKEVNEKQFKDTFNQNQQNGLLNSGAYMDKYNTGLNNGKATTDATAASIGDGISQGIMSKLESMDPSQLAGLEQQLISLQTTTKSVATGMGTSFTNIQNSARTSFMGLSNIVRNQMVNCANIVRNQAVNMSNIFRNQFVNMSNIVRNQAVNMANIMRNQMVNCANIVRNQCVNMANIFRNQFVSMANVARNQMVNVSNIIRNQAISWSNVIRNQVQNARNTMTSSFISMRNVARNQMVAISNIIRNQAVTWSNIIRNQAANMRSAMTSAFAGMAASARAGMANVLSIVRSYMAQIRSETSKTMTMNFQVSKTVTTTNVTKNVTEGLRNTMGAISRGMASISAPQAISIGGYATSMSSIGGLAAGGSITLDVPLYIDGKEVARATAVYNEQELAKLAKRNNRKRGE